jgi:hypothetical protein
LPIISRFQRILIALAFNQVLSAADNLRRIRVFALGKVVRPAKRGLKTQLSRISGFARGAALEIGMQGIGKVWLRYDRQASPLLSDMEAGNKTNDANVAYYPIP